MTSQNPDDPPYPTPWAWRLGEVVRLEAATVVAHARARAATDPAEATAWRRLGDDLAACASVIHEGIASDEIRSLRQYRHSYELSLSSPSVDSSGMNERPAHVLTATAIPVSHGWEGRCKCGWVAQGDDVLDQWQEHERSAREAS